MLRESGFLSIDEELGVKGKLLVALMVDKNKVLVFCFIGIDLKNVDGVGIFKKGDFSIETTELDGDVVAVDGSLVILLVFMS